MPAIALLNQIFENIILMIEQPDREYKVVLMGKVGVGKSSIFTQFVSKTFTDSYSCSVRFPNVYKAIQIGDLRVRLEIFDTASLERFRSVSSMYYRDCHVVILVFSLNDPHSFQDITHFWYQETLKTAPDQCLLVLVGNKTDLKRQVPIEIPMEFCQAKGMMYLECTAKDYKTCENIFVQVCRELEKRKNENIERMAKAIAIFKQEQDMRASCY